MKITGFICELNPLHDGHRYFIDCARSKTDADYLIAVMSGNFVQRGEPAVRPMHERAQKALEAGADLVLQLPDPYACASAEFFARGGVKLLCTLGCVSALCFGAECSNEALLLSFSKALIRYHDAMQPLIRSYLSGGMTYAAARTKAAVEVIPESVLDIGALMKGANNQLALAYLQALDSFDSDIRPSVITRDSSFESSSQIRSRMLEECGNKSGYLTADDFSVLLKEKLLRVSLDQLTGYLDVTESLAHRILNKRNEFMCWSQFTDLLHTKEMTRARVSRCLCHILLDIRKEDCRTDGSLPFIRILGFKRSAAPLLSLIKQTSTAELITNLPTECQDYAADLYQSVMTDKYQVPFVEAHRQPVIVL